MVLKNKIIESITLSIRSLEQGLRLQHWNSWTCTTFESNIGFPLRFMIDKKVTGANWIELPPKTWTIRRSSTKMSESAQIEVDTQYVYFKTDLCLIL